MTQLSFFPVPPRVGMQRKLTIPQVLKITYLRTIGEKNWKKKLYSANKTIST